MVHLLAMGFTHPISPNSWTNVEIDNLREAFARIPSGDFVLLFVCAHGTEGDSHLLFGSDQRVNPSHIILAVKEARNRGVRTACVLLSCFGARNPILTEGFEYLIAPQRACRMWNVLQDVQFIEQYFKNAGGDFFEQFQGEFFQMFKNSHNALSDCWGEVPEEWTLIKNDSLIDEGLFFEKWVQVCKHFGPRFSELELHQFLTSNGYNYHRLKTMFANAQEFIEFVDNLMSFRDRYVSASVRLNIFRRSTEIHLPIFKLMSKITRSWKIEEFEALKSKSVEEIVDAFVSADGGEHFQRTLAVT